MPQFSALNPASLENKLFWESVRGKVIGLINEINEDVFDGKGKTRELQDGYELEITPPEKTSGHLRVRLHSDGEHLVCELHRSPFGTTFYVFDSQDLVTELKSATIRFLELLH